MESTIDFDHLTDAELEKVEITFMPKRCPRCKQFMAIRKLGVWGYYCIPCMFWWGTYPPFPKVSGQAKAAKK